MDRVSFMNYEKGEQEKGRSSCLPEFVFLFELFGELNLSISVNAVNVFLFNILKGYYSPSNDWLTICKGDILLLAMSETVELPLNIHTNDVPFHKDYSVVIMGVLTVNYIMNNWTDSCFYRFPNVVCRYLHCVPNSNHTERKTLVQCMWSVWSFYGVRNEITACFYPGDAEILTCRAIEKEIRYKGKYFDMVVAGVGILQALTNEAICYSQTEKQYRKQFINFML